MPFQAMQSLLDVKDFHYMLDGISNLLLLRDILLSAGLACSSSRTGQTTASRASSTPSEPSGSAFSHNSCSGADVPGTGAASFSIDGARASSVVRILFIKPCRKYAALQLEPPLVKTSKGDADG